MTLIRSSSFVPVTPRWRRKAGTVWLRIDRFPRDITKPTVYHKTRGNKKRQDKS